jgi:hypothetical protein
LSQQDLDLFSLLANLATLVALVPTFIALVMTARQLWAGRLASSATTLVALNESLRQAWLQFRRAEGEDDVQYTFSDVMNLMEIACAAREDGLFVGETGDMMGKYLLHVLKAIAEDTSAKARIEKMLGVPGTFEHLYRFVRSHRKSIVIELPVEQKQWSA